MHSRCRQNLSQALELLFEVKLESFFANSNENINLKTAVEFLWSCFPSRFNPRPPRGAGATKATINQTGY